MKFLYLRDPLFLICFGSYWLNRLFVKPHLDLGFFVSHFNDFICIPVFVPILVFITRVCRLRSHDLPPQFLEVFIPLIVWSILFEIVFPSLDFWSKWVTGDPFDIFWYSFGSFFASVWWRKWYTNVARARTE